jgi:tetratricopeptide (TPR) repeat protein
MVFDNDKDAPDNGQTKFALRIPIGISPMSEFDPNKTVFISYRRSTSKFIARAVFMDLRAHGYDVFMDVQSIDNGTFDTIILDQIKARAHFILILTQGSLDRCADSGDWLRREIETALATKRNIVPITAEGFSFEGAKTFLIGNLGELPRFNSVVVYHEYFDEAMERLRVRYLQNMPKISLTPISYEQQKAVQKDMDRVLSEPSKADLQAAGESINWPDAEPIKENLQQLLDPSPDPQTRTIFDRLSVRLMLQILGGALLLIGSIFFIMGQADIRTIGILVGLGGITAIAGAFATSNLPISAYYAFDRGQQRLGKKDYEGAILDYTDAILYFPDFAFAYNARGGARYHVGDLYGAIADYNKAIRLDSNLANRSAIHNNRGEVYFALGQYDWAEADFKEAEALRSGNDFAIAGLAITYHAQGKFEQAISLWQTLIKKDEHFAEADWVGKKFNWLEPLVDEARKLIATLDQPK